MALHPLVAQIDSVAGIEMRVVGSFQTDERISSENDLHALAESDKDQVCSISVTVRFSHSYSVTQQPGGKGSLRDEQIPHKQTRFKVSTRLCISFAALARWCNPAGLLTSDYYRLVL